jgi:O-antigen/teichoic acid export membrane protein
MDKTPPTGSTGDPTGRDRLAWNVLVSWGSQLVTIMLGFVMPRMVDEELGQVSLGIWDFAWAITSYITLVNFGVGSNAARYVAAFAVDRDVGRLQRIVSSAHVVQLGICTVVLLATASIVFSMHLWAPVNMAERLTESRMVVLLLGLSITAEMLFDTWRGILTGVHRWDVHNGINTLHSVLSAAGMVVVLLAGLGLTGMAAVYFASALLAEFLRYRAARKYCAQARISLSLANRDDIRLVAVFGLKNVLAMAGPLVVQQTVNVLITLRLGPAVLAIFARPAALIRHMETFIYKFAFVLMPMAGSVQAQGDLRELRRFSIDMCQVGWALAVPGGVFLVLLGPMLIELWMGPHYVARETMMALAVGGMLATANRPAYRILFGLDRHGTASALSIFIYGGALVVGVPLMLSESANLLLAAILFTSGDVLFSLCLVPQQLAKALRMSVFSLLWQSAHRPLLTGVISGGCLLLAMPLLTGNIVLDIAAAAALHGMVTLACYWLFVLPDHLKARLIARVRSR